MKKVWEKGEIKDLLQTNDEFVRRSLIKLYDLQTAEEQSCEETSERNGAGFNGVDAQFMSSVAKFYLKNGFITDKQLTVVRRKIIKYAGQITDIANAQAERR